jgi:hypothetical protein
MGRDESLSPVARIGETAGLVWRYLDSTGPVRITVLIRELATPRDLLMQAIGWLARESKIDVKEEKRGKIICLKHH